MTRLRPARPFPPHGVDSDDFGIVDLGVRLRDALFRRQHVERVLRAALVDRVSAAVSESDYAKAGPLLQALLDTWPCAALVDGAREAWTLGPDGPALVVLSRVAELTSLATGAPMGWPRPGEAWIKRTVGNRLITGVEHRHPDDGAKRLAELLDVPLLEGPPLDLAPVGMVEASELPERVEELARKLVDQELVGVQIRGHIPEEPAHQLAAFELRLESTAQRTIERLGIYGAEVPGEPTWDEMIGAAPAGRPGPRPRALAEPIRLPGTPASLARGEVDPTAWLVWDAPHKPLPVTGPAAAVLSQLDGETDADAIAQRLGAPRDAVAHVMQGLIEAGAATAALAE